MHSPILRRPFLGRTLAVELFASLFAAFGELRITAEIPSGNTTVFCWTACCRGNTIEGVDVVRLNQDGQVQEIRVLIRPLVSIALFAQALGPPLARRRGAIRAHLVRALNAPLGFLFGAIDRLGSSLLGISSRFRSE